MLVVVVCAECAALLVVALLVVLAVVALLVEALAVLLAAAVAAAALVAGAVVRAPGRALPAHAARRLTPRTAAAAEPHSLRVSEQSSGTIAIAI